MLLSTLFGCSRQFYVAKIVPGKTYLSDVIKDLGEANNVYKPSTNEAGGKAQVLVWKDFSVQATDQDFDSVVTVVQRKPAAYESSLQFWRQQYKGTKQRFNKVQGRYDTGEHLWQLNIPNERINIIYDESKDKVVEVMYYYAD